MDLFLAGVDFSNQGEDLEKTLEEPIQLFCKERNVSIWRGKQHFFILNRIDSHFTQNKSSELYSYFVGRDFKKVKAHKTPGRLVMSEESSYPFFQIAIDERQNSVHIDNDVLGLKSYFYAVKGQQLLISNYFPAVAAYFDNQLHVDPQSYSDLLLFGTTSPGKTLYKEVLMSHPLENLEFSKDRGLLKIKKKILKNSAKVSSTKIYREFKNSVHGILETSNIHWLNITGGSDTRLILSTLSPQQRDRFTFIFDEISSNPQHIPHDRAVIKQLKQGLDLNISYRFPYYVRNLKPGFHDGPKGFSPYNHLITGMYGGETLGGNAVFCLPEPNIPDARNEWVEKSILSRENLKKEFAEYFGTESPLGLSVALFTNSFMSFIYGDLNWTHPYVLLQKKISPFINTKILTKLFSADFEHVENYRLYSEVFRSCAKEFMQYPFFSRMTAFNYPDVKSLPYTHEELIQPESQTDSLPSSRFKINSGGEDISSLQNLFQHKERILLMEKGMAISLQHGH